MPQRKPSPRRGRPATSEPRSGPSYKIAEWLRANLDSRLKTTQTELSKKLGYERQTMISMMKMGAARVPIDKVEILARELDVDPTFLMFLALEQLLPGQEHLIHRTFGNVVPDYEKDLMEQLRGAIPPVKMKLSTTQKKLIAEALTSDENARRILKAASEAR